MNIQLIDICLPDYFPGSEVPYVQIDLDHGMSRTEIECAIRRAIESEDFEVDGWDENQYGALRRMVNAQLAKYLHTYSRGMASNEERGTDEPVYAYVAVMP
ncbi:MAG: hypothetical protein M1346_01205 [Gammaproteobacteria bacterium]|nr:hypothetical protein [Gammaproteobacteria bacterium]